MKLFFIFSLLVSLSTLTFSVDFYKLPSLIEQKSTLRIYGAADYPAISPLLNTFQEYNPSISIEYTEFNTRVLYKTFLEQQPSSPDIMLSSAMDLQVKLVNDGYAQTHYSKETHALPKWASWRNEIFGFTYEPAVIAFNNEAINQLHLPRNRSELLSFIRQNEDLVRGRIGTFDIETVGVGHLTWAHDRQQSGSYGRMLESFGRHQARRFPSSSSMLEALINGEIVIAYNLLGSYAQLWAKEHPVISIVMPEDYTALVMRTAFIPKRAENSRDARLFLNFLLSAEGQLNLADKGNLYPILTVESENKETQRLLDGERGWFQPIPLGLSLLAYTDQAKRQLVLDEWEASMKSSE